ncbi:MAG: Lrp/AsnC family transcriptional regulator [Candidatus Aenigmarchaeota archaeon]|nr:Lrp/AsnC family transcriptional regulator [Candidatus Aenigmarchaeota archaeon]
MMDQIDFGIIELLDANSRISNTEIARKVGVSEGTVRKRIEGLIDSGLIEKFTIEFGVKRGLKAFVLLKYLPQKNTKEIVEAIKAIPEVRSCFQTTGEWDMIVRVFTDSSKEFNNVVDKIRKFPWIIETKSLVVLDID